ncbi:MAG: 50S ribosomal protein L18 [Acidobacteria bacterium 13_1_20CM_2_57_8]|nr:MAG: 50S ribosomal protein L18 [Acidobacteria bacterium 13_1_20CM_2_57_8]
MPRLASNEVRVRIHRRIRKTLSGSTARPRLSVYRSNKHIYAQIIDDARGTTLTAASSRDADAKKDLKNGGNVLFDRGGYLYHGRIKALAEAAREAGLKF